MNLKIKRALISVTDKRDLGPFASALSKKGVELIASGGTAAEIGNAGIKITEISDVTGFPEVMDGRVKTLHPKIHAGILADRAKKEHLGQAKELGIDLIDLVVVNLYRFREAAENPELGEREIVEEIDIGGPTLIRAAAKNYQSVTVLVDPDDYAALIEEMDANGDNISIETRLRLASKAFHHTTSYDAAVSGYFDRLQSKEDELSSERIAAYRKIRSLRYGENPHLRAGLYMIEPHVGSFGNFEQLQGKDLSYNNIQDMYAAFLLARDLGAGSCAIMKHMNPCGAASCGNPMESYIRAMKTDPASAFGSVVSFNG
ncbi:MAG: bifunctional phosphoribosylaminoimidazolecarboxamide formyltransferase/IMP cyclohydrolase, partial [Candidatus Krumholzibacteria bacterium]|nr:bifunctional phosphoribosylaminoimidazolecarboxamide formyltransferase/IMP cyclohydrolase [Candidatus Krumholzibacteria bacterium]